MCATMLQLSNSAPLPISQDRMDDCRKLLLLSLAGKKWELGPRGHISR